MKIFSRMRLAYKVGLALATIVVVVVVITVPVVLKTQSTTTTVTAMTSVITQRTSALTTNSQTFCRQTPCIMYSHYAQTFEINITTSGTYYFHTNGTIDTYGCRYVDTINASDPYTNRLLCDDNGYDNGQFMLVVLLESTSKNFIVVSTKTIGVTGSFTIIGTGPSSIDFIPKDISSTTTITLSKYESILTNNSQQFCRTLPCDDYIYYAQAFEINVTTNGTYYIRFISGINMYGYIYNESVDSTYLYQNLLRSSDFDMVTKQYMVAITLEPTKKYILVATTDSPKAIGSFSIVGSGLGSLNFAPVNISGTSWLRSEYASALTTNSQQFCVHSPCDEYIYYAQAFEINITTNGTYYFRSRSDGNMNIVAYIYNESVDATYPYRNYITFSLLNVGTSQYMMIITLQQMTKYVLVVTTSSPTLTGPFTLIGSGPYFGSFTPVNMTETPWLRSEYSSLLTNNSQQFCRSSPCDEYIFYAQAFEINVTTTGMYYIRSNGTMPTYGYIYNESVDTTYTNRSLLEWNGYNYQNDQFMIIVLLEQMTKYILVVTSYAPQVIGSFTIIGSGPNFHGFTPVNMTESLKFCTYSNMNMKWNQNATTIIGGYGLGNQSNQLAYPVGIFVIDDDDEQSIYIADSNNHRIMKWIFNTTEGQVIAGGNQQGNRTDQLNTPTDMLIDKINDSIIICDQGNRRIVQWSLRNDTIPKIMISNIDCWSLAMDTNRNLYISDYKKNVIKRYNVNDLNETLVIAYQLDEPTFMFIGKNNSVYVTDGGHHRIIRWMENENEGIVVAGAFGNGTSNTRLSYPQGIFVDSLNNIYIVDGNNNRIMQWHQGCQNGQLVIDGNQFNNPKDLTFDRQNNIYIVDTNNHRIQKFHIQHDY
ncbi:unnamed protein product [Adineta ricciae]|uniref:NHL repeat containing protein n=1 Tax=Adineta ricciae TaxID=249248 RepID=A0A815IGH9_ADIRI|nr:unnamed protein product [Adineta ricciae]